ncbi:MAG TPA: hypothetical protein PKU93_02670 [Candidatus Pacearchaeota archaeon]|nr:hypothetical protein [Candidatus Pacearchaeota archaeon]
MFDSQEKNGSFANSILLTSIIASCLDKENSKIREGAIKWLLSQNKDFVFSTNLGINFYALIAIFKNDSSIINGSILAKILKTLISVETKEGGPYTTDIGINTIVAYFLSLQEVYLPNIQKLLHDCVNSKNFESDFIRNKYFIIYLISKSLKDKKQTLVSYLLKEKNCSKDALDSLLILNSLLDLGCKTLNLTKEIELLKKQNIDRTSIFCIDSKETILNSPSLANAFYLELINKKKKQAKVSFFTQNEKSIINLTLKLAEKKFESLPQEIAEIALNRIKKTIKDNKDKQMSLMAYYTREALGKKGYKISDQMIAEISLTNILFWTAFVIYDDFWDEDECKDPKLLPIANLYARHYVDYFSSLFPEKIMFNNFFHKLMDKLDAANTWENIHCRAKIIESKLIIPETLPDYGDYSLKFYPSSGHIFGSVAIFCALGYYSEVKPLITYFKHYLIAMQINDDAHDLEEDLGRGHLSTVAALVIKDFKEKYPLKKEIDLNNDLKEIKQIFWFKTVKDAAEIAIYHTQKSREALKSITILEDCAPLEHYINIVENVAKNTLIEQKKSIDFLKNFK